MLQPRGLEVRLVSKNSAATPIPLGTATIYSQDSGVPQVVGQDRIPHTPPGADFSVTQGRSTTLQGTRRIIDRHTLPGDKLVARIEVVINNRSAQPTTDFVREGIENWGKYQWTVTESTHPHQKLGDRMIEFKLPVPASGTATLQYTVEIR